MCLIMFQKHITFVFLQSFPANLRPPSFRFIQKSIITDNLICFCKPWLAARVREIRFLTFPLSCAYAVCSSQIPYASRRVESTQLYWVIFQLLSVSVEGIMLALPFARTAFTLHSQTLEYEHVEWVLCESPDRLLQMVKIQVKCTFLVEHTVRS